MLFLLVLLASAGCDHAAKVVARDVLGGYEVHALAGGIVRFELAHNAGGMLSVGAGMPETLRSVFFLALVPLVLIAVCALVLRSGAVSPSSMIGIGLVAGGGVANWLDRALHQGLVTDYVSIGLGPLRTGIFNWADVCVFAGTALLLLGQTFAERGRTPAPQPPADP
jgi:signal peptidase II